MCSHAASIRESRSGSSRSPNAAAVVNPRDSRHRFGVHDSAHHGCCGHVPDVLGGTSAVDHRSAPRGSGGVSGHPGTTSRGLCPE
jgi:hypothetical protein